jgi:hypothetical protein
MKYNSSISAAFMRFLTKVMGGNVASEVSGSMAQLEAMIKTLKAMLKEIKKESEGTCSCATAACNATEDAKKGLTTLYQANSSLKK